MSSVYQLPLFSPDKLCSSCKTRKPYTEFHKNRAQWDGFDSRCRECKNEHARLARQRVAVTESDPARADPAMLERFWAKVARPADAAACWLWLGAHANNGYGQLAVAGKTLYATRVMWWLHHGPISRWQLVCHNCPGGDNPRCVNPDHLFLGTPSDNMMDLSRKGMTGGEHNSNHRLTTAQVVEIRRRYAAGGLMFSTMAKEYGVSASTVRNVVRRFSWQHLCESPVKP